MISEKCKDWYHNCNKENFKFFILPLFSLVPYRVKIRVLFMFPFLKCHENFCYLWGPYTYLKAGRGRHNWNFNFFQKGHTLYVVQCETCETCANLRLVGQNLNFLKCVLLYGLLVNCFHGKKFKVCAKIALRVNFVKYYTVSHNHKNSWNCP